MTYIRTPFAESGQRTEVPNESVNGAVSFETGYGLRYSENPTTVATALRIERLLANGLYFRLSAEIQQYQQLGTPAFILPAENNGVAFPYAEGAMVRYNPVDGSTSGPGTLVYRSLVDNNTALPTVSTNWLDTSTYTTADNVVTTIATNAGLSSSVMSSTVTLSLNLEGIPTTTTIATNHTLPFSNGSANQKTTVQNFLDTFVTGAFISGLAGVDADSLGGSPAASFVNSSLAFNTLANAGVSGGGDLSTDRNLSLDIDNLSAATPAGANEIAFSTGSNATRKSTIDTFIAQTVTGSYISSLAGVDADSLGGSVPSTTSTANSIVQRDGSGIGRVSALTVDNTTPDITTFVMTGGLADNSLMARRAVADFKTDLGLQNLDGNSFNGNFVATGRITGIGGITSNSDRRLKNEHRQLDPEESLAAVLGWRKSITSFNEKAQKVLGADSRYEISFYAQDILETHPQITAPVLTPAGEPTTYNAVAYDRTPVVIASALEAVVERLDELSDRMEELENRAGTRLDWLYKKIEKLEGRQLELAALQSQSGEKSI